MNEKMYKFLVLTLFGSLIGLNAQVGIHADFYIHDNTQMHITAAETQFHNGQVTTSRTANTPGVLSFAQGSTWEGADHSSHVNGYVRSYGSTFDFPTGHDNQLTLIRFVNDTPNETVDLAYAHVPHTNQQLPEDIGAISPFYWAVNSNASGRVHLSWGPNHQLQNLSKGVLDNLRLLGFDGTQWVALDTGLDNQHFYFKDAVDDASGSLHNTGTIDLSRFSALALGSLKILDGSNILISQAFTPNGDGINDTWFIQGIENYPNAQIWVYNRWGQQVFHKRGGYQNDWGGNYQNNTDPLPSGSYLYIIDWEGDGSQDKNGWIYINN